jgi:hypothetical protein
MIYAALVDMLCRAVQCTALQSRNSRLITCREVLPHKYHRFITTFMKTICTDVSEKEFEAISKYADMCGESASDIIRKIVIQEITFMKNYGARDPEIYEYHMLIPIEVSDKEENEIIETNYNKIREILGWRRINLECIWHG